MFHFCLRFFFLLFFYFCFCLFLHFFRFFFLTRVSRYLTIFRTGFRCFFLHAACWRLFLGTTFGGRTTFNRHGFRNCRHTRKGVNY
ncbi:hypothetical protein DKB98_01165 [Enterococcus faecalis]|nr:hypothetical protein DKC02_08520 [Enterococcus faecalis]PWI87035.1 hypothetical protein DKB98_01165 [Enterococcus faecalis]PWI90007.1 hypothetical protein DKC03_08390 [Enterococcus faecalis]